MDSDLALILGLILVGLSIPAIMSAVSDGRPPRAPMVVILIGGVLVIYALAASPGGYSLAEIPDVFFRVVGRYLN